MFKNLTNFGYQRNKKEAFGFYLVYLFLFAFIGAAVASVIGLPAGTSIKSMFTEWSWGEEIGLMLIALGSAVLSLVVLFYKKEARYGFILLALISGVLSLLCGGLFGFIIPAYFTTLHPPAPSSSLPPQ
jgi:asparagine N-glycosylation enzyme membrane subunit Stt3